MCQSHNNEVLSQSPNNEALSQCLLHMKVGDSMSVGDWGSGLANGNSLLVKRGSGLANGNSLLVNGVSGLVNGTSLLVNGGLDWWMAVLCW